MKKYTISLLAAVLIVGSALMVWSGQFEDLHTKTFITPNITNYPTASLPAAGIPGRLAFDSTVNRFAVDTGAAWVSPNRILSVNTTSTASASTTKSTLLSYSLPANTLNQAGRCVKIKFWGTAKATANNKTQTIDFGAVTVATTGAVANNNGVWNADAIVCRTGANAQTAIGTTISAATGAATQATATETDTAAITIAGTATNVTDVDGTTAKGLLVEVMN